MKKAETPILDSLIKNGNIYKNGNEYIGIASDNVHVLIGGVGREKQLESYLTECPNPTYW